MGREEREQSLYLISLCLTRFLQIICYFAQLISQHLISAPQSLLLLLFTKKIFARFKLWFSDSFFNSLLKLLAPLRYPQLQTKLVQSSHPTVWLHNCHSTLLLFCSFCPFISPASMYWVGESFRSGPHLCLHCVNTEGVKNNLSHLLVCLLETAAPSDLLAELLIQVLPHQIRDSEQG